MVLLGNNQSSRIKGSGNIRIRIHDGIERVLTKVRYVPELKRNLISLGTLDFQGYSFKSGADSILVSKGYLVVMKAVKRNLLYVLQGDTIIGSTTSIQEQQDRTKLWHLRLGHTKDEAYDKFREWLLAVENKSDRIVKHLRTDNGLEYLSDKFVKLCKEKGITRHRTVTGTPQQNDLAERMNRTLLERVRCMLINASLSKSFWGEALSTACYLDSQISVNDKLPIEVEYSVPNKESDEMQDYDMTASDPKENLSTYNLARDRTRREIRAPKRFGETDLAWYALTVAEEVEYSEPDTYDEAMTSKQKNKWIEAMNEEMNSLEKNQTWTLVDRPKHQKTLGCKLGLKFEKQQDGIDPVVGYVDSNFAGNLDTRKSLTGYVFTFYGTTITWKSNLQSVVALSTTEAEFIVVTEAIKEGLWLKGMIAELGVKQDQVVIASEENHTDAMTKSLPYAKFKKCLDLVNAVIGN
ncbi:uncharacterized protein [Henckelia pumila]|uniref:uncharacterized protein n=1 Tax=Henckelia pumila TaxID=405737 RepID=UPI003C6E918C